MDRRKFRRLATGLPTPPALPPGPGYNHDFVEKLTGFCGFCGNAPVHPVHAKNPGLPME